MKDKIVNFYNFKAFIVLSYGFIYTRLCDGEVCFLECIDNLFFYLYIMVFILFVQCG